MTSTRARRSSGLRLPITRGLLEKPVTVLLTRARRATRTAAAEATSLGAFHADWDLKVGPEADARRGRPSASHLNRGGRIRTGDLGPQAESVRRQQATGATEPASLCGERLDGTPLPDSRRRRNLTRNLTSRCPL